MDTTMLDTRDFQASLEALVSRTPTQTIRVALRGCDRQLANTALSAEADTILRVSATVYEAELQRRQEG